MQQKLNRRSAWAAGLVMAAAVLCASCGGGGSGDSGTGTGNGTGTGGGTRGPTGTLWHNNYPLDYKDGTQTASLDGAAPSYVTSDPSAIPWSDGSQYVVREYEPADSQTTVRVYDTATKAELYGWILYGYVRYLRPSPTDKGMLLALQSDDSVSPADHIFLDLDAGKIVQRIASADWHLNWMPDGRYLKISPSTGDISASAISGTPTRLGRLDVPNGRALGSVWVNPQATKISMVLSVQGITDWEPDIFVANIDGSGLTQFTDTSMSHYGVWSPDGNYLAFDVDTGRWDGGAAVGGTCDLYYAPATASMLKGVASDSYTLMVKDASSTTAALGCDLIAWLK